MILHVLPFRRHSIFAALFCAVCFAVPVRPSAAADAVKTGAPGTIKKAKTGVIVSVLPGGAQRFVAGRWATTAVNAENHTDSDVEETAVVHVGDSTDAQFARRFWIPARSTRRTWLPFQIPADLLPTDQQLKLTSLRLLESDDRGEDFRANLLGEATVSRMLMMSWETSRTAAALYRDEDRLTVEETREGFDRRLALIALIYAGRDRSIGVQDLGVEMMGQTFIPPVARSLDSIDQFIIGGNKIFRDTAAVSQLRQWLYSGGRLWIMIDQVQEDLVRRLLGDAMPYSMVDRIELNEYELETVLGQSVALEPEIETWSSDDPVEFVRVLEDSGDVQCRIDGWPVAFWKQVGYGEVLFTSLGSRGFIDEHYLPRGGYTRIADRFFLSKLPPPKHTSAMDQFVEQEIGYSIPARRTVAAVLGLHALGVLIIGLVLLRQQRGQVMSLVIPSAAVAAAVVLVLLGIANSSSVPATVANAQIAKFNDAGSEARIETVSAVYSPQPTPLKVESAPEALTVLRETDWDQSKRMLWTDDGRSTWQNVEQPSGAVRYTDSESTLSLPQPWYASGTFTEQGFEGQLVGAPSTRREDGVIVSITGPALAVKFDDTDSNSFSAGVDNVLLDERFIDSPLLTEIQKQRQDILLRLSRSEIPLFDERPSLLLWTDHLDRRVKYNEGFRERGVALAALPIRYARPTSGSSFRIPASFVRMDTVSDSKIGSTVFNPFNGRWIDDFNKQSKTQFLCGIPKELMPCKLTAVKVTIRMNAPGRSLILEGTSDGQPIKLYEKENPNGLEIFEITDPSVLELDDEGRVHLSIEVTATQAERIQQEKQSQLDAMIKAAGRAGQLGGGVQLSPYMDQRGIDLPEVNPEERVIAEKVKEAQEEIRQQAFDQSRDTWRIEFVRLTMTGETL